MQVMAYLTIISALLALLSLALLHVASPEFKPSWRMISEYALGKYKVLITAFFILWGISTLLLTTLLFREVTTNAAMVGIVLLVVSAIGELMGGLFDVKHKNHGLAFLLGVPTLPIAALLIGYNLVSLEKWNHYKGIVIGASHATWISVILMAITMMVLFNGFKKTGLPMGKEVKAPDVLPKGVIGINGYANRILVLCYIGWIIAIASIFCFI